MCGYLAYFSSTINDDVVAKAQRGLKELLPRGQTSQTFCVSAEDHTVLAHARLKITGENGQQPFVSRNGMIWLLVNGQFYNQDLIESWTKDGTLKTDCDSELALALYEKQGLSGLKKLRGEFSLCLWDKQKNQVVLMRDQAGIKPLKYMHDGATLVVASSVKAILPFVKKPSFDMVSLIQSLSVQYADTKRTLFEGVSQVPPGGMMVFTKNQDTWKTEGEQWFKWFDPSWSLDPERELSTISQLRESVRCRIHPTLPMAIHLSGGVDSTTVALLTQEFKQDASLSSDVEAFTVEFEKSPLCHDESALAQQTAKQLGLTVHKVFVSQKDILQRWQDQAFITEGFGVNGHFVAKQMLAERVHQEGFRIVLSGEGADEALLGYPFFLPEKDQRQYGNSEKMIEGTMLPHGTELPWDVFLHHWGRVPLWLRAKLSLGAKLTSLLKPQYQSQVQDALERWAISNQEVFKTPVLPIHQDAASWAHTALGNYILPVLADAPEAHQSIQGRTPFLDPWFLRHCFSLSPEQTGLPMSNKKPLRDFLTEQGLSHISMRPKHSFQAPPLLSSSVVRQELINKWSQSAYWEDTPFCAQKIKSLVSSFDHREHDTILEPVVCTLLSFTSLKNAFQL